MKSFVIIILINCYSSASSQDIISESRVPLSPADGWEALRAKIVYPEFAERIELNCALFAFIKVDSSGSIDSLEVGGLGTELWGAKNTDCDLLALNVKEILRTIRWSPARHNGRAVDSRLIIPIVYFLNDQSAKPLIIEGEGHTKWNTRWWNSKKK